MAEAAAAAHFRAFGWAKLPALLDAPALRAVRAEVAALLEAERAGLEPGAAVGITGAVEESAVLFHQFLVRSSVLRTLASELMGEDFIWTGSELSCTEQAPPEYREHGCEWRSICAAASAATTASPLRSCPLLATGHADRPGASECGIVRAKCLCYLTATSADGGAIRTIPGSHANPLHESLRRIQAAHPLSTASDRWAEVTYGTLGSELPCSVVEAAPGDAVLLHGSTYHAVCECDTDCASRVPPRFR